jgi:hypothetical protein
MRNARSGEERTRQDHGQQTIEAQAAGSKLGRTNLEFGRARWMRGNAERMNGKAKGSSDRNTFLTCFTSERGSGLEENLRLFSLILAYLRLMGEKCLRALCRAATFHSTSRRAHPTLAR